LSYNSRPTGQQPQHHLEPAKPKAITFRYRYRYQTSARDLARNECVMLPVARAEKATGMDTGHWSTYKLATQLEFGPPTGVARQVATGRQQHRFNEPRRLLVVHFRSVGAVREGGDERLTGLRLLPPGRPEIR
jgi:hypothetical protein